MAASDPSYFSPASEISVSEFREILIWPLALASTGEEKEGGVAASVREQAKRLVSDGSPWRRVTDPLRHVAKESGPPDDAERQEPYAEFVYFHDFVQRFLYETASGQETSDEGLRLYERKDLTEADFKIDGTLHRFEVARCHLYLFRIGVAVLALELVWKSKQSGNAARAVTDLTLADVQLLQDYVRRSYTPYFWWNDKANLKQYFPAQVPEQVVWRRANATGKNEQDVIYKSTSFVEELARLRKPESRTPPVFEHWQELLKPLRIRGYGAGMSAGGAEWRHVVDDRIPFMSFVRLFPHASPEARNVAFDRVARADWVRLCFADPPGPSPKDYPSCETFVSNFEYEHCYDRFRHWGTRQLFCGYAYALVTTEPEATGFLVHHFRHMYFQMALLAHMEYAAYLVFSSRISEAVRVKQEAIRKNRENARAFNRSLLVIQEDFLDFVHLSRFTGVSNQIQGKEMFDLWRKHLHLESLFKEVKEELETATAYLFAYESDRRTDAALRLNVIAAVGLVLGLAFGFLGMNVLADPGAISRMAGWEKDALESWGSLRVVGGTIALFAALGAGMTAWLLNRKREPDSQAVYFIFGLIGAVGLSLAAAGALIR